MTLPDESREDLWKAALQPLRPDTAPSPELIQRMTALAAGVEGGTSIRSRQSRGLPIPSRLRLAFALFALVVGVASVTGFVVVGPKVALAHTLRTVASNLRRAQGVHYRVTFFRRGKVTLSQEIWYRQNQWRLEGVSNGARLIQIKANGRFWNYDPARRVAWYQKETHGSWFPGVAVEEQMQTKMSHVLSGGGGEDLGMVTYNGQRLQQVAVPSPVQRLYSLTPVPGRTLFTIDRGRMLPTLTEQQVYEGNTWVTVYRVELDVTGNVAPDKFTIRDKNVRFYDINAYGAQAGKRFSLPLATRKFATRTIALRDVQVNRDGDVFVLYTDGSTREKDRNTPSILFTDDQGTVYAGTAGAIEPFMYHQNPENSRGMTVSGEVLKGLCMAPLSPPTVGSSTPRRFKLVIQFTEQQNKKSFSGTATFTVPLRRTDTLLPDYSADLAALSLAGGDAEGYRRDRESARQAGYFNRQDWTGLIQSTNHAISQGISDANTYLARADAFDKLGRPQEARRALAAARTADEIGFHADEIARAEARLTEPR